LRRRAADFILEEFLSGGTLTTYLQQTGLMPRQAVIELGTILIGAVEHIASKNFVHRDLKPDNIMLRTGISTPVIVDFGLVRDLTASSLTDDWQPRGPGTPYLAPRAVVNAKVLIDWRTDCLPWDRPDALRFRSTPLREIAAPARLRQFLTATSLRRVQGYDYAAQPPYAGKDENRASSSLSNAGRTGRSLVNARR
jgi:serine/threonine protein kinase